MRSIFRDRHPFIARRVRPGLIERRWCRGGRWRPELCRSCPVRTLPEMTGEGAAIHLIDGNCSAVSRIILKFTETGSKRSLLTSPLSRLGRLGSAICY